MARLGRGQPSYQTGHNKLGPPQVVGPATVFAPVSVTLAPVRDIDDVSRLRQSHYRLGKPQVVSGATVFAGPTVKLARNLPPAVDPRRKPKPGLAPPAYIFRGGQIGAIGTSLADPVNARSDGRRRPHSRLSPPAVLASATFAGPSVTLAPIRDIDDIARRVPHSKLKSAQVVGPATVYRPVAVNFAKVRQSRPTGKSRLAPPTTLVTPVFSGPSTTLAPIRDIDDVVRRLPHSHLFPPAVVGPVQLYGPVSVKFAKVRQSRGSRTIRLTPPTVVSGATVFRPVNVWPTEPHRPAPTHPKLAPPAVISFGVTDNTVDVHLARHRDVMRRLPKSRLRPPTVVGPVQLYGPVKVALAPSPRQARKPHPILRPPQVVTPQFIANPVKVALTFSTRLARRSHPKLPPPSVVGPVQLYGPVKVELVPSPRQARATHTRLRPPTVVFPFVAPKIRVQLRVTGQEVGKRRPVTRKLRPPVVITTPSDVIFIDYYDHPKPLGLMSSDPREDEFQAQDFDTQVSSSPAEGTFDPPKPIGEMD